MADLQHFLDAQEKCYAQVRAELQAGRKRSHWMWFVFPQIEGLGHSQTARFYAIGSMAEARAFLADPVLGARLRECTQDVLAIQGKSLLDIFGTPDDMKFRSCMTLFSEADVSDSVFRAAIERYCPEGPDRRTLQLLGRAG